MVTDTGNVVANALIHYCYHIIKAEAKKKGFSEQWHLISSPVTIAIVTIKKVSYLKKAMNQ